MLRERDDIEQLPAVLDRSQWYVSRSTPEILRAVLAAANHEATAALGSLRSTLNA